MNTSKKIVFDLIIFITIAFAVVSLIIPHYFFNSSDLYDNREYYWKNEISPLLDHTIADDSKIDNDLAYPLYESYSFPGGIVIYMEGAPPFNQAFDDYSSGGFPLPTSAAQYRFVNLVGTMTLLVLFIYFSYGVVKEYRNKKTRYFLYIGILVLIWFFCDFFIAHIVYSGLEVYNSGLTNFVKFEYGFYLMIVVSVLFFIAYFMQDYLLDFPKTEQ